MEISLKNPLHNLGIGLVNVGLRCGSSKGRKIKRIYDPVKHSLAAQMRITVPIVKKRPPTKLTCFWCGKLSRYMYRPDDIYECTACMRRIAKRVTALAKQRAKRAKQPQESEGGSTKPPVSGN